jgi:hypothetical protein
MGEEKNDRSGRVERRSGPPKPGQNLLNDPIFEGDRRNPFTARSGQEQ